jgi:hypothetical protein
MKQLLDFVVAQSGLDDIQDMGEGACKMVEEMMTCSLAQAFSNIGESASSLIRQVRFDADEVSHEVVAMQLQGNVLNLYGDQGWDAIAQKWSQRYHNGASFVFLSEARASDATMADEKAVNYLTEKLEHVKTLMHAKHLDDETISTAAKAPRPRL